MESIENLATNKQTTHTTDMLTTSEEDHSPETGEHCHKNM